MAGWRLRRGARLSSVRLEAIGDDALHVAIDMQRLFAEAGPWHAPALESIVPRVERLCRHAPGKTVFTRFITPQSAAQASGRWRRYYEHWHAVTLESLAPEMLDLVTALRSFAPPARIVDKATHSSFNDGGFETLVERERVGTLILSGVETDVCVLATAIDAVDRGLRVVIAEDAVASSSPAGHAATLEHVLPRMDLQVDIADLDSILQAWPVNRR